MDETFWHQHGDEISAAITVLLAIAIAVIVDRYVFGRAEAAASRVDTEVFSRGARTRLRLLRRLTFVVIIGIGIVLALSQFAEIRNLATGILASTAVLGLVIGFAARTVFANAVAGVLMAFTQPLRIGDLVVVGDGLRGRVVDTALTYTSIESHEGAVIIVPNEKLTTDVVINRSAAGAGAPVTTSIWAPAAIDLGAARQAVEGIGAKSLSLAELSAEGARLEVQADKDPGRARDEEEAELRERVQDALRRAGLLEVPA